ncbi:hypothetical protein KC359_g209 [Hortaea werneckii]|nr:hypothetical protein KC359_g209 [Hortaea werneckii]
MPIGAATPEYATISVCRGLRSFRWSHAFETEESTSREVCQDRMLRQIAGQNSERHRAPTLSERLALLLNHRQDNTEVQSRLLRPADPMPFTLGGSIALWLSPHGWTVKSDFNMTSTSLTFHHPKSSSFSNRYSLPAYRSSNLARSCVMPPRPLRPKDEPGAPDGVDAASEPKTNKRRAVSSACIPCRKRKSKVFVPAPLCS